MLLAGHNLTEGNPLKANHRVSASPPPHHHPPTTRSHIPSKTPLASHVRIGKQEIGSLRGLESDRRDAGDFVGGGCQFCSFQTTCDMILTQTLQIHRMPWMWIISMHNSGVYTQEKNSYRLTDDFGSKLSSTFIISPTNLIPSKNFGGELCQVWENGNSEYIREKLPLQTAHVNWVFYESAKVGLNSRLYPFQASCALYVYIWEYLCRLHQSWLKRVMRLLFSWSLFFFSFL